jgi:hypothetical protein
MSVVFGSGPLRIIRTDELELVPWANRAGYARDIALDPSASPGWRVSLAEISVASPFSNFPGVDRSLIVIGGRVTLEVDGEVNVLDQYRVFKFDGGSETRVTLDRGPVRALNVMTQRALWSHSMAVIEPEVGSVMKMEESEFVMLLEGAMSVRPGITSMSGRSDSVILRRFDVVVGDAQNPEIGGTGRIVSLRIFRTS